MRLKSLAVFALLAASGTALAVAPFKIRDIRVEGLERTEPSAVFSYLPVKIGDQFTDAVGENIIKSLYGTGFFSNVSVEAQGDVVLLTVEERPIVSEVQIEGAKSIPAAQIRKSLERLGVAQARVFDPAALSRAVGALKAEYENRGKSQVSIETETQKLERGRLALKLKIDEGATTAVKNIEFEGNEHFSGSTLKNKMKTSESGWLTWLDKSDGFSGDKLEADLKRVIEFYQDEGYAVARVDSYDANPAPDDPNGVNVKVKITEGPRFRVGSVNLVGDSKDVPMEELGKLVKIKQGDWYSLAKTRNAAEAIVNRLGEAGFAAADAQVLPQPDPEGNVINLVFNVVPNNKVYVRRVNISGNSTTKDEVIRRELRQMESAVYDSEKIKRSKERVELLGFFDDVRFETEPVEGSPDQVDLNVKVKERRTGSLNVSVGYVQNDGFVLSGGISQDNLFGTGKSVSARFSNSSASKIASLSFTDPYFTKDNVSLGYDLFWRNYNPETVDVTSYKMRTYGGSVRLGLPITEHDRLNFSLGAMNQKLDLFEYSPQRYIDFVNEFGDSNTTITGSAGWGRNTTDSAFWPTKGYRVALNADAGLPGGDIQYYKLTHSQDWFFPLADFLTLRLGGQVGYAKGYGNTKELPFFHNFYNGGLGFVRGYSFSSLGPKMRNRYGNTEYLGGDKQAAVTAEALVPMPGMKDQKSVRLSLFADAGSVWDGKTYRMSDYSNPYYEKDHESTFGEELRYSVGAAVTWLSPFGAMKVSFALPLKEKDGDELQRFQFQWGSVF